MSTRWMFPLMACLLMGAPTWGGHTLAAQEENVLKGWLAHHPEYRIATDEDCDCADDIKQMKAGSGGAWKPLLDYHPYIVTGDFNGDGVEDFAVVPRKRIILRSSCSTDLLIQRQHHQRSCSHVLTLSTTGCFMVRHDQSRTVSCSVASRAIQEFS